MALVFNIAQIRLAYPIALSNTMATWKPFIEDAEQLFIRPILGDIVFTRFSDMSAAVPDEFQIDESRPTEGIFVQHLRKAVALYALHLGVDQLSVTISASGTQIIESDTHKPAPVFAVMNQKDIFLSRAHRQVDFCLEFLEKYPSLVGGSTMPENPCLFKNAAHFQKYCDIRSSRRVFISLLPVIANIEMKFIRPTLSNELYADIKSVIKSSVSLTSDYAQLLDLVFPALAHLSMSRALLEIPVETLDWGIFNSSNNTFNSIQTKSQANKDRIAAMQVANERDGEAELKMVQEFLDNSASETKFPLYFASSRYTGAENAVKRNDFINDATNGIFVA